MAPPSARRRLSAALAHLGTPLSMSACSIAPDDERQRPSYSHHHSSVDYSSAEVEARVEELRAEGWVVLPDCIEPELVPKLIAASDRLMAQEGDGNGIPGEFASIGSLAAKDDVYWQLLDNSNLLAVVRGFLGEDCLLSAGNTRNVHPGSGPTGIHVSVSVGPGHLANAARPDAGVTVAANRWTRYCTGTHRSCASSFRAARSARS